MQLLNIGARMSNHFLILHDPSDPRHSIGKEIGVDPTVILATSHGRRSIDVLKLLSPEKANWECESLFSYSHCSLHWETHTNSRVCRTDE